MIGVAEIEVRVNRWLPEWSVYRVGDVIECGSIAPGLMAVLEVENRRADARAAFEVSEANLDVDPTLRAALADFEAARQRLGEHR